MSFSFTDGMIVRSSMRVLGSNTLVSSGKVLYPAISNFSAWQTAVAVERSRQLGLALPVCAADVQLGEAKPGLRSYPWLNIAGLV